VGFACGFFYSRRHLDILPSGGITGFLNYPNLPQTIGSVVSAKLATLGELQTIYSLEDVYNLMEVLSTDSANEERARKIAGMQ